MRQITVIQILVES